MNNKKKSIINFALTTFILAMVYIVGNLLFTKIDLTEEKRYTLSAPTKKILAEQKDVIYARVLLEGEFPAGFKRLQKATKEMLNAFRDVNSNIQYKFENIDVGTVQEKNGIRKELAKSGIVPVNLRVKEGDETSEKLIYPYIIFHFGDRTVAVNLLENETPGMPPEVVLNNSVGLLEYKFASAIEKLKYKDKPIIIFTEGHGELAPIETADLERNLSAYYELGRLNLDSVVEIKNTVNLLIIAKPRMSFTEQQKFKIDQYVMNGGKIMWLIDKLNADLDSMQGAANSILPVDYPLNIDDQLFKYGARIQPNLVLDLECTRIPLRVGQMGSAAQFDLFPWYYYPIAQPSINHPITKNLDRISLQFPSSIDTIKTKTPVKKSVLIASSKYSRLQYTPTDINFEILRYQPDPSKFDKPNLTMGLLLEGEFPSLYENRVTSEMMEGLNKLGLKYKDVSSPTKMIVVSDGDIARNLVGKDGTVKPLGLNKFENKVFSANKDFLLNSIEYMLDSKGIIEARTRDVKLRMLDTVRTKNEKVKWQLINLGLPLVLLFAFGYIYNRLRKRRFGISS